MTNPWDKIFIEDFDSALKIANENIAVTNDDFDFRARALINLHQADYATSLDDFLLLADRERERNMTADDTSLYIGLCHYALGESDKAMHHFEDPVKNRKDFKYTSDISRPPAILYYMAIRMGNGNALKLAERDLKKRKTPIAEFLTDRIDEREFEDVFVRPALRNRCECRLEFYKSLKALKVNNNEKHQMHLSRTVELKGLFLEFEYYFSKVELEKLASASVV